MPVGQLEYLTAVQMKGLLASRKASALELLDLHLQRVRELNPVFNAVVALDEEGARRQARAADDARARGTPLGLLHGVPMTIKDTFEVVGMPTTAGFEELRHYQPVQDAAAVARIRQSGAVIFGKTNLPAGAADHQSCNTLFGLTRNPWNVERTVGGSSGGSAAALAAGMTPLEFGSDIGGSTACRPIFAAYTGTSRAMASSPWQAASLRHPAISCNPNSLLLGRWRGARSTSNCCWMSCSALPNSTARVLVLVFLHRDTRT